VGPRTSQVSSYPRTLRTREGNGRCGFADGGDNTEICAALPLVAARVHLNFSVFRNRTLTIALYRLRNVYSPGSPTFSELVQVLKSDHRTTSIRVVRVGSWHGLSRRMSPAMVPDSQIDERLNVSGVPARTTSLVAAPTPDSRNVA